MKNNMANKQRLNTGTLYQRAFSLVELMVSLVVGLILIYGVSEIYVNSKVTYNVNEEMSRMQESARFAFDLMVPTVRETGYTGCLSPNSREPVDIRKTKKTVFDSANMVQGSEYTGSSWTPSLASGLTGKVQINTDVLTVQSTSGCGAGLTGNMDRHNANIQILSSNTCKFEKDDSVLITDCSSADLFTVTNHPNNTGDAAQVTLAHANGSNTDNRLSKLYFEDAEVLKPSSTSFYIGTGGSLFRRNNLTAEAVELVEGVESMQVLYGLDTDAAADGVVNRYLKANEIAADDWDKVITARISFLLRSVGVAATASGSYTFDGVSYGADRFLRQEYTSTVQLRNRNLQP